MAIQVLNDVDLLAGGYRYKGNMNACALDDAVEAQECTVYGDTAVRRVAGIYSPAVTLEGYFDGTLDGIINGTMGLVNVPVTVAPLDSDDGNIAFFFRAMAAEYSAFGAVGEVNPFTLKAVGSDGSRLVRGTIMHSATQGSTGNGTARQLGAITSGQKMYAALHVLAASGSTPTLDVVIASDDNGSFTSGLSRITFSQANAISSEWQTVSGAITDDFWRVQYTIGGGSPSFTFIVVLGIL